MLFDGNRMTDNKKNDVTLVDEARNGNNGAFDELMAQNMDVVFQIATRMLDDREEAKDIVQEAFLSAYRNIKNFRGDSSFRTWITTIATRIVIGRYRRKRVFVQLENVFTLGRSDDHDTPLDGHTIRTDIARGLEKLSAKEKMVFVLRLEQQLSTAQTAKILDVTEGTVKTLLHRANAKMRKFLATKYADYNYDVPSADIEIMEEFNT